VTVSESGSGIGTEIGSVNVTSITRVAATVQTMIMVNPPLAMEPV